MIHTQLPLSMYSVGYELVRGRPYSPLEAMLLRTVLETSSVSGSTFADLRSLFQVHDRLLTEALVTLIQEGWVAMRQVGQEMHFMITDEGKRTVDSGRQPESVLVRTRRQRIAMERLSGQLIRASELMMVTRAMLRRARNGKPFPEGLPPRVQRTKLNVGEVERLLPRSDQHQEWIRWIDPAVRVSQDMHYLPIQVDLDAGCVFGLPPQWRDMSEVVIRLITENASEFDLGPAVGEAVRALARKNNIGTTLNRPGPDAASYEYLSTAIADVDVAVSANEKRHLLDDFAAVATGSVFVVANGLVESSAKTVQELVVLLLKRGVNVDLLWSSEDDDEVIISAFQRTRGEGGAGKLTLLANTGTVTTDLVLGTAQSGPVAIVGTSVFAQADRGISARLAGYRALTSLARLAAGWWEESSGDDTAVAVYRWRHTAERWASEGARESALSRAVVDCGRGNEAETSALSLIAAHQLPAALRVRPAGSGTPEQWFLDTEDRLVVANAGGNSVHFVFAGSVRSDVLRRLRSV
ncbi:hypothetical protein [Amycolatopsis sp. NPDC003676]